MALYGFHNLQDLANTRIVDSMIPMVNDAIQAAVAEHNRQMDTMLSLFVARTTDYKRRYAQIANARLQPLDDNGRARPIKPSGYYDVALPIQAGGSAWGANYVTRAKMTVGDAERITASMLSADFRWVRDHILSALFINTTWTFTDDLYGDLTIQPLANGDSVTYGIATGADAAAADTHQLAQANAIGAGADNPYPAIYTELLEHSENTGKVIAFIPTGLKATTTALATFNPVPVADVRPGSASDVLIGRLDVPVPGTVLGQEDSGVWVVEWPSLPAGYIVAVASDGPRPLGMREDPEPELQGFKKVAERNDHPFYENQFLRRAGFGAWNRVGAVVQRIGNGSYAVPTNYTAPMW